MAATDPFSQLPGLPSLDMLKPRTGLLSKGSAQGGYGIGGGLTSPGAMFSALGGGSGYDYTTGLKKSGGGGGSIGGYPYQEPSGALANSGFGPPMGTDLTGMTSIWNQQGVNSLTNAAAGQAGGKGTGAAGGTVALTPEQAAANQMSTERAAYQQNISSFTDPAKAMLANKDPYDSPSFPAEYWDRLKRQQQGTNAAQFNSLRSEVERQARMGLISPLDAKQQLLQLSEDKNSADQKAFAQVDNQRIQQAEKARLDRANLYLRGAQIAPYAGEDWTAVQQYLQGSADADTVRNALTPLLQGAGLGMGASAFGGGGGGFGGGGGGGIGASGDPLGFQIDAGSSNSGGGQYLGGSAAPAGKGMTYAENPSEWNATHIGEPAAPTEPWQADPYMNPDSSLSGLSLDQLRQIQQQLEAGLTY